MKSKTILSVVLLLFILLASVEADSNLRDSKKWKEYKNQHNFGILHEDFDKKAFENFQKKDEFIGKHNNNPKTLAKLGHNDYSYMSHEEINSKLKGFRVNGFNIIKKRGIGSAINTFFNGAKINLPFYNYVSTKGYTAPVSVDWRQRGFNTPVRNQNPCGNCWAFASTGALEASIAINLKTNVTLSPQQLTDCAGGNWGNWGCDGGFSITAYNYIFNNSISTESFYPFTGQQATCSYSGATDKKHGNLYSVSQMYMSQKGDDQALIELLDKYGPVTIGMDASSTIFDSYKSGIFASPKSPAYPMCNSSNIDHAMLLMGYGVDNVTSEKFWLIKNTWGTTWGENGFIRVSREVVNNCGISSWGVLPVAATGAANPTTTTTTARPATSTARPATTTAGQTTSTARPATSTARPATTTARPATSTARPATTTAGQTTSTARPATSTAQITTTTATVTASNLTCDGKIHADPGCKTAYICIYNTISSTCIGGMWSAASSNSTCGQSYTSCQSYATWNGCPYQGVFLTTQCSKRIQCTLNRTIYTATTGYLIDETGPYYRPATSWKCPI